MELKQPKDLEARLGETLDPVYLVSGDEPLLAQEAADAIRAAARAAGVSERARFDVEPGFEWREITQTAGSRSLFAERRLIEVRMRAARPVKEGAAVLSEYAASPPADDVLLVVTPRLESGKRKPAWARALADAGVHLPVWPIGVEALPRWLRGRLDRAGLRLDADALELLQERVEGNLLAATQAIERLQLVDASRQWDAKALAEALDDDARYTPFELIERALAGDRRRTEHIVRTLRAEGVEPLTVNGALARELRILGDVRRAQDNGESLDAVFKRMHVFLRRRSLMGQALRRLRASEIDGLLRDLALIDQAVKGRVRLDPWDELSRVALRLAGVTTSPLGLRMRPWLATY